MGSSFNPNQFKQSNHQILNDAQCETVGEFLWDNFLQNLNLRQSLSSHNDMDLIKTALLQMMKHQGADPDKAPRPLLGFMDDREVVTLATHLYAAIQLIDDLNEILSDDYVNQQEYAQAFLESTLLCKAFEESNPYVLRFHVFALHNRLFDLLENREKYHEDWRKRCDLTFHEAKRTLHKIETMVAAHPAFAHFLLGYSHYTLALGAFGPRAEDHLEEAYRQFELTDEQQNNSKRNNYIITLGQGIYKDMPFNNLNEIKAEIQERLNSARRH